MSTRLRRCGRISLAAFAATLVVTAPAALADEPHSQIRAAHESYRAALRSAVVQESIDFNRPFAAAQEAALRERMQRDLPEHERQWRAAIAAEGGTDEEWIAAQRAAQHAQIDKRIALVRLSAQFALTRTRTIDFAAGRSRYDDVDARNVAQIATDAGLTDENDALDLSRTRTRIHTHERGVVLYPRPTTLGVASRADRFDADAELLTFGVLPPGFFAADRTTTFEADPATGDVTLTSAAAEGRGIARLSANQGWRVTRFETFDADGTSVESLTLDDYREVDGSWAPFSRTRRTAEASETATVESVRLNVSAAEFEGRFDVSTDYRVRSVGP